MKIGALAATAALLAGCSSGPAAWRAETVPAVLGLAVAPAVPKVAKCAPIDVAIAAESQRMTPLDVARAGGLDVLTAALMGSEAEKNARLRQAVKAYEACRRGR